MKPILECHGLSKQYNRMNYALQNLNLALEPGQIVGLLGPNGSGKTTLIKLINDLLVPTEGRILICGALHLPFDSLRLGPVAARGGQSERRDRHAAEQIGDDMVFHSVGH